LLGDDTMSSEHAAILCRDGRYQLYDRQSTNGTYVDGQFVESNGVDLQDGARIKTGETVWLFRMIQSDDGGTPETPSRKHPPPGPESHVV
jgi:pSer/pThr/pTyr-binding forkhead associated (FHA) protein